MRVKFRRKSLTLTLSRRERENTEHIVRVMRKEFYG